MTETETDAQTETEVETDRPKTISQAFQRAVEHHQAGDLEKAGKLYRLCLANRPDNPTMWTNFGALLRKQKHFGPAVAAHRKALELDPDMVSAQSNLANALSDLGEAEEAARLRERLLTQDPDDWVRIRDLAVAYRGCWRNQDAVDLVDAAEARLGPDEAGQLQRALAHLMLGNYADGFRDFEARYSGDEVALPKDAPWPRWTGQDLTGKRIVVLPEQGFGDALVMARFLPRLKALGCEVTHVVKPPLMRLMQAVEGVNHVLGGASKSEAYDYYTPNMSLPHLVGLPHDGPPPAPRLSIPEDSRARAETMLAPFRDRFRIGIVWTGSLTYRANHRRSAGLNHFAALAVQPGVQLFSLYKGEDHGSLAASGMAGLVMDACGQDRDFADTAAVIEQMDLMITTDTAVVHVAAALGKPVWNLLSWEGFWLYGAEETTPWYPSMRLFRQTRRGGWDEVFALLQTALRDRMAAAAS